MFLSNIVEHLLSSNKVNFRKMIRVNSNDFHRALVIMFIYIFPIESEELMPQENQYYIVWTFIIYDDGQYS